MASNNKTRYIARIDTTKNHGWRVTFTRPRLHTKLFSDSVHGGSRKALTKARRYRDRTLPAITRQLASTPGHGHHVKGPHICDKRCKTGVVGVRYAVFNRYHVTKGGKRLGPYPHACYIAKFGTRGNTQHASFGIRKYGRKLAFRLACRARRRGLAGRSRTP